VLDEGATERARGDPGCAGEYWTYVERARLQAIRRVLPHRAFDRVLDVGCGRGEFSLGLARMLGLSGIQGVDGSGQAVAEARARGIPASVVDLNHDPLPFEAASMDLVLMLETLEHLEDVEHCLDEIRRVLAPGGSLVVTTPNLASWHGRISLALGFQPLSLDVGFRRHYGSILRFSGKSAGHIRGFTRPALTELLAVLGFEITGLSSAPAVVTGQSGFVALLRGLDRGLSRFPNIGSEIIVHARRNAGAFPQEYHHAA
jgi:methionine biosynthesis protein MetW